MSKRHILTNKKDGNNPKHNNTTNFFDHEIVKIFKENASKLYAKNCLQPTNNADPIGKLM